AVTDNLYEDHDRDGLIACSLVCHSWLPSGQRHLFHRVMFFLDGDDCERKAQAFLSSPHLANYIRELKVHLSGDRWAARKQAYRCMDQSLPAAVLRKLNKLQSIELRKLDLDELGVDLRQSLRSALLLPSLTSLTLNIINLKSTNAFQNLLMQGDQEGNDDESRQRICLSRLNLDLDFGDSSCHIDWFLGPRSPYEISHIQTLRVVDSRQHDEKSLNRLLRKIGSSLKHLEFYLPPSKQIPRLAVENLHFDIKLEFNSNITFLRLTNIDCTQFNSMESDSFGQAWLLRLLSNIGTSNKLEQIELEVLFDTDEFRDMCSASAWGQVDCILAGKFRNLQKLDIQLLATRHRQFVDVHELAQRMLDVHPLLIERDVSVDVRCKIPILDLDADTYAPTWSTSDVDTDTYVQSPPWSWREAAPDSPATI
ncbi:hypothetical protein JB92DRAFT_3151193, partial [Gautieria morchelliformis]